MSGGEFGPEGVSKDQGDRVSRVLVRTITLLVHSISKFNHTYEWSPKP